MMTRGGDYDASAIAFLHLLMILFFHQLYRTLDLGKDFFLRLYVDLA